METLLAMISFRDAPHNGTSMDSGEAPRHGTSATGGSNVAAATKKKWPVERLAASMAFCEAPFDGTLDGTTAAPSSSSSSSSGSASGDAMERRILAMVFRDDAPLDGNATLPPSSGAAAGGYDIASAIGAGVSDVMASMPSCEAPPPSVAAGNYGCSAPGVSSMVASALGAATRKLPIERLVASMAFCEAPLDGTLDGSTAPSSVAAAAAGGSNLPAATKTKKWPVERLVASMAFCEAPLDGAFVDGATAPSSSGGAREDSASATNVPVAGGMKECPLLSHRLPREKAGTGVDGLAIFETVVLQ